METGDSALSDDYDSVLDSGLMVSDKRGGSVDNSTPIQKKRKRQSSGDSSPIRRKRRGSSPDDSRTAIVDTLKRNLIHTDYTIGWICALVTEYVAAQVFLDERHEGPEYLPPNDNNNYTLGKVGSHNVVIAVLPHGEYGVSSAAGVAKDMLHSFPNIRFGLMVGVGGGAPSPKHDIRLGDVVVSSPRDGMGGVLQYDFGKAIKEGIFNTTGFLNQPPTLLRTAVSGLQADHEINGHQLEETISTILERKPRLRQKYKRPQSTTDRLYKSTVPHLSETDGNCVNSCGNDTLSLLLRPERTQDEDNLAIHYGLIASGNQVMKDAVIRDKLIKEKDILCFETEAAGLMNQFPCIVIRGICDYSDSHKNEEWQGYAAMAAAAYTKDLLYRIPLRQVEAEKRIGDVVPIMTGIQKSVDKLLYVQKNEDYKKVLEWLTPNDYAPQHRDYINIWQPETGRWFLSSEEFQTWIKSDKHTLFCPGGPGTGKTIMTAMVIDHLYTRYQDDSDIGIAYIYCDYRKHYEQKVEDLLSNLLKQLTQRQAAIPDCIQTLYDKYDKFKNAPKRPLFNELSDTLLSVCRLYSKVFIVVDALDECQAVDGCRKSFLSEIFKLQEETHAAIFATARPIPEILEAFKQSSTLKISAKDEDVQTFLAGNIQRLPPFVMSNLELQSEIEATISKIADGVFLVVRLHVDSLAQLPTVGHIKQALRNLPSSLGETYEQAMARIGSQSDAFKQLARKVLSWLIYTKRVLSIAEIQHAVATEPETGGLDREFIPDTEIMCSVCAGLVTLDIESGTIRLAHYSILEYFRSEGEHWFRDAETNIAWTCFTHIPLASQASADPFDTDDDLEQTNPLYKYAIDNVGLHGRASLSMIPPQQIIDILDEITMQRGGGMDPIHFAAAVGLDRIITHALENGYDIDSGDVYGQTALWWASAMGQTDAVKLLIDCGAEIDTICSGDTPLMAASRSCREAAAKLLVENGADVNFNVGSESPLYWALVSQNEYIVRLLVENGADVNFGTICGESPLALAIDSGNESIVRLLLDNGADINSAAANGYPPLSRAVRVQNEGIVKLLLENGADVEGIAKLHLDSIVSLNSVAKLLLRNNVDLKGTAKMLRDNDVDLDDFFELSGENGIDFGSNSKLRLKDGIDIAVIDKLLREKGIDIDAITGVIRSSGVGVDFMCDGQKPLFQAIVYGNERIARLLLENGANVDFTIKGDTPLSWATKRGLEGIVNLLQEYGSGLGHDGT